LDTVVDIAVAVALFSIISIAEEEVAIEDLATAAAANNLLLLLQTLMLLALRRLSLQ
jgi:hypothetical protein